MSIVRGVFVEKEAYWSKGVDEDDISDLLAEEYLRVVGPGKFVLLMWTYPSNKANTVIRESGVA